MGVYFLLCEEDGEQSVCIGEIENVHERLKQHFSAYQQGEDPYYWTQATSFVDTDLNKALIRYLEDRLRAIAKGCCRAIVLTKATYGGIKLKESQIASLEEYLENVNALLGALGCDVLVTAPQPNGDTVHLFCATSQNDRTTDFVSGGGFTVMKGSRVSDVVAASLGNYDKLRSRLENDGVICGQEIACDYEFSSPAAAAAVVYGYSVSGNVKWKTTDGVLPKDLQ